MPCRSTRRRPIRSSKHLSPLKPTKVILGLFGANYLLMPSTFTFGRFIHKKHIFSFFSIEAIICILRTIVITHKTHKNIEHKKVPITNAKADWRKAPPPPPPTAPSKTAEEEEEEEDQANESSDTHPESKTKLSKLKQTGQGT